VVYTAVVSCFTLTSSVGSERRLQVTLKLPGPTLPVYTCALVEVSVRVYPHVYNDASACAADPQMSLLIPSLLAASSGVSGDQVIMANVLAMLYINLLFFVM